MTGFRRRNARLPILLLILLALLLDLPPAHAVDTAAELLAEDREMLGLFYGSTDLATKTALPLRESPTPVTVITRREMIQMGARDLRDVLRLVPGFHVTFEYNGYPVVGGRGTRNNGSEKIKFYVDGHPVNSQLIGGATHFFADMPVDYIEKLEVLRGPGSALHGSSAMSAVVNIITRKADQRERVTVTARGGVFDSQRYNLEVSRTFGEIHLWGDAHYYRTKGADVMVDEDILSRSPRNADISLAPGHTAEDVERSDLLFAAGWGDWSLAGQYIHHQDGGFFNPSRSLADRTSLKRDFFWADLGWRKPLLDDNLDLSLRLRYNRHGVWSLIESRPPGFTNAAGIVYPDGMLGEQRVAVHDYGAELKGDWYGIAGHIITAGIELSYARTGDIEFHANYDPLPLPRFTDVSDTYNWLYAGERFFYSPYLQDQWRLTDRLTLFLGARYDHYDDFGGRFTPHVGAVFHLSERLRLKGGYSESFRAPALRELYKKPQGSPLAGNPELDPETSQNLEATLEVEFWPTVDLSWTVYRQLYKDIIRHAAYTYGGEPDTTFTNGDRVRVLGTELMLRYRPAWLTGTELFAAVSCSDSEDETGNGWAGLPKWLVTGGINGSWRDDRLLLNLTWHYNGPAPTLPGDTRGDHFDDFLLTTAAVTVKRPFAHFPGLDLFGNIHNLFDVNYSYPCLSGDLPDCYQRPGITVEAGFAVEF
ncbi:MAG: TonB-dependent receptor [Deltaproteobacteria bacterium]|nr:TonB-dependent receptor [Candidatus Anaeroferrophillacea bacterium]